MFRRFRATTGGHIVALLIQSAYQITSDETVTTTDENLHEPAVPLIHFPRRRSRSASTIMATSCSNPTLGAQPSSARALDGSACSRSTSAGRMYLGSVT